MKDKDEQLRSILRDVCAESEKSLHLGEAELIAYHQGRLEEFEQDRVQSHLVQCQVCRHTLKAVAEFLEPGEEAATISEQELARRWRAFQHQAPIPVRKRRLLWPRLQPQLGRWLVAAGLIAGIGVGVWTFRAWQENGRLARQSHLEREGWAEERDNLERDARQWQEAARQSELQLAELRQPEVNPTIHEIFSREFIQRGSPLSGSQVQRITVPPETKRFVLILNGGGQPDYPEYAIEMRDAKGQVVWQGEGLKRNQLGNFTVGLNRAFVTDGEYRLTLRGRRGDRVVRIAEYVVIVRQQRE